MKFVKMNLFVFLQMEHFDLKQNKSKVHRKKKIQSLKWFSCLQNRKRDDLHRDIDIWKTDRKKWYFRSKILQERRLYWQKIIFFNPCFSNVYKTRYVFLCFNYNKSVNIYTFFFWLLTFFSKKHCWWMLTKSNDETSLIFIYNNSIFILIIGLNPNIIKLQTFQTIKKMFLQTLRKLKNF